MVELILLILAAAYAVQFLAFLVAAIAATDTRSTGTLPSADVIIAARDEEKVINTCLTSMLALTYPKELLNVYVVDDRSTDATASMVRAIADRVPWIHLLSAQPERDHLRGKANAVAQAIEASKGEIIVMTDADCIVPPGWIENIVAHYSSDAVGLVAGFTSLQGRSAFARMQALDWFGLFTVAAAALRMGYPVTAVGTNLSVRRTAYDAVGGFRSIPFSITEDYALFRAVTHEGGYTARFPMDPATLVQSAPCRSAVELYRQKKRWFAGGKGMHASSLAVFGIEYLFFLLILIGFFAFPATALAAFAVKIAADFLLLLPAAVRFRRWTALSAFPLYELYFFLYVLVYPPIVLFTDVVVWKGRDFLQHKKNPA